MKCKSTEQRYQILLAAAEEIEIMLHADKHGAIKKYGSFEKYVSAVRDVLNPALEECHYTTQQDFTGCAAVIGESSTGYLKRV